MCVCFFSNFLLFQPMRSIQVPVENINGKNATTKRNLLRISRTMCEQKREEYSINRNYFHAHSRIVSINMGTFSHCSDGPSMYTMHHTCSTKTMEKKLRVTSVFLLERNMPRTDGQANSTTKWVNERTKNVSCMNWNVCLSEIRTGIYIQLNCMRRMVIVSSILFAW